MLALGSKELCGVQLQGSTGSSGLMARGAALRWGWAREWYWWEGWHGQGRAVKSDRAVEAWSGAMLGRARV